MSCSARPALLGVLLLCGACASAPPARETANRDRTDDPEFAAARAAAQPEFETQADALAAGVYEPFVHPDSVGPGPAVASPAEARTTPRAAGDPSTEELLGTLDPETTYNPPVGPPASAAGAVPSVSVRATEAWTVQLGAFDTETGALVRIQQLARDFPDLPRWHATDAGTYRVFLGRFADRAGADRVREAAVVAGYGDAWVTRAP